jgi:hypothetical protein
MEDKMADKEIIEVYSITNMTDIEYEIIKDALFQLNESDLYDAQYDHDDIKKLIELLN